MTICQLRLQTHEDSETKLEVLAKKRFSLEFIEVKNFNKEQSQLLPFIYHYNSAESTKVIVICKIYNDKATRT